MQFLETETEEFIRLKCKACNCINAFFVDDPQYIQIRNQGFGLHRVGWSCIIPECYCHTGLGNSTTIMVKKELL